ncbi:MAG: DMT family transporter [Dehalococcoidia bacterium]
MGEAAALISALCWAGTSVALARLGTRYGSAVLSGLRFLIASPFVIALLFVTGNAGQLRHAEASAVLAMVASAAIGYGIGDTLYIRSLPRVGLQRMSPSATALWVAMSAAGAVLILGEPAGWDLAVGGTSVVAGVYLVVSGQVQALPEPGGPARLGAIPTLAVLVGVASAWAAATLILAGGRGSLGAIAAGAVRIPAGGAVIALVATVATRGTVLRRLPSPRDFPLLLAIGIGGTAVGSLLYIYAVATAGAARAVILNSTSPLMVVPLSMIFLGERPTMRVGVGTLFCLAGTLIVVRGG